LFSNKLRSSIRENSMARGKAASTSREIVAASSPQEVGRVAQAILDFVSRIPESDVSRSRDAESEARQIASKSANRAALTAGSLALPPGPMGWLTVLPELIAIWKIQAQMVSDIAAAYGKTPVLGREQMLWCLFRHTAAQAFRDIAIRVGDRLVFRRAAGGALTRIAQRIGVSVSKRAVGKGMSRWLPIVGALGVGAYAYYDTGQVAKNAIELFSGEVETTDDDDPAGTKRSTVRKTAKKTVASVARKIAAAKSSKAKTAAGKAAAPRKTSRKSTPATRAGKKGE
jgi:hypothetical protein